MTADLSSVAREAAEARARAAEYRGKRIGMIKCTHCGCELTSRLTVWVHVHSGSHQCDGGMDIGVPVMDARGRIVYQDAPGERAAEYRKAVQCRE